jgi:hypothetical protein
MRLVIALLAVAALVGGVWVFSLPTKAECVASGRVVDPTERHCESAEGYQQLQEHALFHSREAILAGVIVLGVSYGISRYRRRSSKPASPAA